MYWFYVSARKVEIKKSDTLVSDSVNVYPCKFQFSADWLDLVKHAVFKAGTQSIEILLDGESECNIPWEVLIKPKLTLYVGCYGTKGDDIILNTAWTSLGKIEEGARNNAVPGEEPTPDIYNQLVAQIGDMTFLQTEDKSSIVNAINEVNAGLDTKLDKTGGTVTGPILFSENSTSTVMAYTFEDEPIQDSYLGITISSDGIYKTSDSPLKIQSTSNEINFGENAKLTGVLADESDQTSVPNIQQVNKIADKLKESIPVAMTAEELREILNK